YGGTLDLLSKSYAPGENFAANMAVYGRHLAKDLGLWVLPLSLWGGVRWGTARPRLLAGSLLLYIAAGPLFLYLANMPPNPHALAIVEPHYMLSDLVLCLWAGAGLTAACLRVGGAWPAVAFAAVAAAAPVFSGRLHRMDRRWDLFAHDWADSALRSAPPGSVLVAKKDVQIFALWHHQRVLGRRPDVVSFAQGLAHTPWHQEALRRSGAALRPGALRSKEEWQAFLSANPKTVVTMDAEFPPGVTPGLPRGLAAPVPERPAEGPDPAPFLVLRGDARYEQRPDFFSADLVESWASARQRRGGALAVAGQAAPARRELFGAWALKRRLPDAADLLGYLALTAGDAAAAAAYYETAAVLYDETFGLVREYNSLPETRRGITMAAADSAVNLGVAYEKLGRKPDAERVYRRALSLRPDLARAHFNIAVLHWGADWRLVVSELEAALAADPGNADALRYLPVARAKLRP
ncbi:tetratricopeptide repeat protein, partial [bacterium]